MRIYYFLIRNSLQSKFAAIKKLGLPIKSPSYFIVLIYDEPLLINIMSLLQWFSAVYVIVPV